MSSRVIVAAQELAASHHAQYDPSHDIHHVSRVTRLALSIASTVPSRIDTLVVHLAALFHDLVDAKYLDPARPAPTPATRLAEFWSQFSLVDVSLDQRRLVEQIVDNVSYSKERRRMRGELGGITEWHETCLELHCVQDADKLDAIGAFGILRCAAYSAIADRPLYAPPTTAAAADFPPSPPPQEGGGGGADAISHFGDKLVHLESMIKTDKGKQLARRRTERLHEFVRWTRDEFDDLDR